MIEIIVGIIGIGIQVAISFGIWKIADNKGYDEARFFWLALLLGITAWIVIIALPQRVTHSFTSRPIVPPSGASSGSSSSGYDTRPSLTLRGDGWVCKNCGTKNEDSRRFCKDCGTYK